MRLISLTWSHIRRILSDWKSAAFMLLSPAFLLAFSIFTSTITVDQSHLAVQYLNLDTGAYGAQLLEENALLGETADGTLDEQLALLENYEIDVVVVIPEEYSAQLVHGDVPSITYYERESSDQNLQVRALFDQAVKEQAKELLYEEYGLSVKSTDTVSVVHRAEETEMDPMLMVMVLLGSYFIILFSTSAGSALLEMRENKVSHRLVVSPNHGVSIFVSLALAYFLLTFVPYALSLSSVAWLLTDNVTTIPVLLAIVALMSFFGLSFSLFVAKVVRRKEFVSLIPTFYGMIGFFSTQFVMMGNDQFIWNMLSYLTPLRFIADMILHGDYLRNGLIIFAMALLFLFAGGFQFQKFIED